MPAIRLTSRRRRSSHAIFTPAKPGIYGVVQPRPVTFAPNVTPVTYVEPDDDDDELLALSQLHSSALLPPSSTSAPPPTRKRCPPGKRRSQGYIPRPPNAFMLFRADFVRQKHVPGSIETNHGSLSKIIGNCWHQLPLEEKRIWELKAKQEKANHKAQFPDYRFRPVHNKNKNKDKSSSTASSSSNNTTVRDRDSEHVREEPRTTADNKFNTLDVAMPIPISPAFPQGLDASGIALPSVLFMSQTRPSSPVNNISRQHQQRSLLGHRRASSAQPVFRRSFTLPNNTFMDSTHFANTDFSTFDWMTTMNQAEKDSSSFPSADVDGAYRQHQQRNLLGLRRASSAQAVFGRSWALPNNTVTDGAHFANTDFSAFDWMSTMNQVEKDNSPLPDADTALFNGFSFDGGASNYADSNNILSSSASSSSASARSSPWLEPQTRPHSQHRTPLSIAPHDLPPLEVSSSDMNWHSANVSPHILLSSTSTTPSSTFPSPCISSTPTSLTSNDTNAKVDSGVTPTDAMFNLNLRYGLGMEMGTEYSYGYNEMGFDMSNMSMGMGGYNMMPVPPTMGGDMGMAQMDTMWTGGVGHSQPQQA